jgi:CO dehydrogenase nickel-insertion accessory protein CooC1
VVKILISGERGTGKSAIALAIYEVLTRTGATVTVRDTEENIRTLCQAQFIIGHMKPEVVIDVKDAIRSELKSHAKAKEAYEKSTSDGPWLGRVGAR